MHTTDGEENVSSSRREEFVRELSTIEIIETSDVIIRTQDFQFRIQSN